MSGREWPKGAHAFGHHWWCVSLALFVVAPMPMHTFCPRCAFVESFLLMVDSHMFVFLYIYIFNINYYEISHSLLDWWTERIWWEHGRSLCFIIEYTFGKVTDKEQWAHRKTCLKKRKKIKSFTDSSSIYGFDY